MSDVRPNCNNISKLLLVDNRGGFSDETRLEIKNGIINSTKIKQILQSVTVQH